MTRSQWFWITTQHNWLKKTCASFFIQSEVKRKQIAAHLHTFTWSSHQLHVFNWFKYLIGWLVRLNLTSTIPQNDCTGFKNCFTYKKKTSGVQAVTWVTHTLPKIQQVTPRVCWKIISQEPWGVILFWILIIPEIFNVIGSLLATWWFHFKLSSLQIKCCLRECNPLFLKFPRGEAYNFVICLALLYHIP